MSLERRIDRVEKQMGHKASSDFALFDSDDNEVWAELLEMPTAGSEGLARFADGSVMPVVLQDGSAVVVNVAMGEPKADRLYYRRRDAVIVVSHIARPPRGDSQ